MSENVQEPIVITSEGGVRFAAQIRSHRVMVDQPESAGGFDSGPMPVELLGAALGTCIALYVRRFLEARGLPTDGTRVEVMQHSRRHPSCVGLFEARVILETPIPVAYVDLLERVVRSCPVHNTLTAGADVQVSITAPVPLDA